MGLPASQDKPFPFPVQVFPPHLLRMRGQRHLLVLQVICRKCSEFKAENSKQSRVCRECFLEESSVPSSPSSETPTELKQNAEVGGPGARTGAQDISVWSTSLESGGDAQSMCMSKDIPGASQDHLHLEVRWNHGSAPLWRLYHETA